MINFFRTLVLSILKISFQIYFFVFGQPKSNKNVDKVMDLYNLDGFTGWFKKIRFWDAPYLEVEKFVPRRGVIVELGCGEGIFSNYMAVSSSKRKIFGVDLDRNRIKEANGGLKNVRFKHGDATRIKIPKSDAIVMFHLLHHLTSFESQEKVIRNCFKSLKKRGRLIIVEIDIKPTFKYLVSWITDHFVFSLLFEKKLYEPEIFFRAENEWVKLLKENGLKFKISYAAKGKPFSHIIFDCSKTRTK